MWQTPDLSAAQSAMEVYKSKINKWVAELEHNDIFWQTSMQLQLESSHSNSKTIHPRTLSAPYCWNE